MQESGKYAKYFFLINQCLKKHLLNGLRKHTDMANYTKQYDKDKTYIYIYIYIYIHKIKH